MKPYKMLILFSALIFLVGSTVVFSKSVYPLNSKVTLDYWVAMNDNVLLSVKNYGDTPFAKELQKRTGIKINYIHP